MVAGAPRREHDGAGRELPHPLSCLGDGSCALGEQPAQHLRLLRHLRSHQQASLLGHDTTD